MGSLRIISWTILMLLVFSTSFARSEVQRTAGLMVTTPMTWVSDTVEAVCLMSRVNSPALVATVKVLTENQTQVLSVKTIQVSPGERVCTNNKVDNEWRWDKVVLLVSAKDDAETELFNKNATINLYRNNKMMFLQTDKPVYKPSDTVRIRILTVVGPDMKPVTEPISKIHIEDPARTRVMQWKDINTTLGLGSVEMKLSSEPPLGVWTIHAKVGGLDKTLNFEVKEYVLPKYSVDILNDASIYKHGTNATWKVCATYTYGEPVNGQVNTYICNIPYAWSGEQKKCVSYNNTELIAGCKDFVVGIDQVTSNDGRYHSSRNLEIYAEVAEKGTGIVFNATSKADLADHKFMIDFSQSPDNYKPGLVYYAKGFLKDLTGAPVPNKTLYLTFKIYDQKKNVQPIITSVQTNKNGVFNYNISDWFTAEAKNVSINIEISLRNTSLDEPQPNYHYHGGRQSELGYPTTHTIRAWYSSSNTYLQITPLPESDMTCKIPSVVKFTLVSKTELPTSNEFNHQITSHGNLITVGARFTRESRAYDNGLYTYVYSLHLSDTTDVSLQGNVNILVYYIRADGETVADGLTTKFTHCFKNKVSATFSDSKSRPGHESSFSISASAQSLCSIVVVDKSIKLMGASYLTSAEVENALKTRYDLNKNENIYSHFTPSSGCVKTESDDDSYDGVHPMRFIGKRSVMRMPGGHSDFVDSQKPFEDMGLLTLTDLTLMTRPCKKWQYRVYMSGREDRLDDAGPVQLGKGLLLARPAASPEMEPRKLLRKDSSEKKQESASTTLHRNFFPETWLWDLHLIGVSGELKVPVTLPHTITEWIGNGYCINSQSGLGVSPPFSVTGFQSFFMSFTLPYSMIRGEEVAVPVSVFNYLNECLKVTLTVEGSTAFRLVNNTRSAKLKVCGQQAEVHTFYVVPKELGKINFTVKASSSSTGKSSNSVYSRDETDVEDIVTREILVEAEGKPEEISKSAFVCGSGGGDWTFSVPSDVVPDSERSDISVIGDVMGPALSGLDSLLRVPTGCGEQNMLLFAPNIYVLQYLNKTKRLTSKVEAKALDHMRIGYQRELNYRHDDGSFSAFGKSDTEGSIWLTAFVVQSFAQAKPYMYIDDKDLKVSVDWIISKQLENGCFPLIGRVIHKDMMGGVQGGSVAPLTAFILLALLQAGVDTELPVIKNAVQCLDSHNVEDVYTLSVMSYAYSVLGDSTTSKSTVMSKLQDQAIVQGDLKHWESSLEMTHDQYHHASPANIETTSYVLLALLQSADLSIVPQATPIVRWLSAQRNSLGGFCSTQDTVLALHSLAEYAGLVHNDNIDLHLQVATNGVRLNFDLTSENSLLLQKHEGLATHKVVHYNVEGTGCALLQATVKFNRLSLQEEVPPSFELMVNVKNISETKQKCSERTLNVCVRYNGTDEKSNMAIVAIKMVSGWIPVKDSVQKLKNSVALNLKRFDIEKNSVQLYFDEIDGRKKCFDIDLEQDQYVSDSKPAIVHAYDYYQPAAAAFSQYEITSTCLQRRGRSAPLEDGKQVKPGKNQKQDKSDDKKPKQKGDKKPKKSNNCPSCDDNVDNASLEDFCDSPYVFKVLVGRGSSMNLKQIIRSKSKPSKLPALSTNIKYKLPKNCQCGLVTQGKELLISTSKRPHQKDGGDWMLQIKKGARVLKAEGATDCPVA